MMLAEFTAGARDFAYICSCQNTKNSILCGLSINFSFF